MFLIWDDALRSGSMSSEDVEFLKESLLKKEYNVLPTKQDKWVSLHSSFGLICWSDDDKLGREFKHLKGVDFLYFGESSPEGNQMAPGKISDIMKRLGIPVLSEVLSFSLPVICTSIFMHILIFYTLVPRNTNFAFL